MIPHLPQMCEVSMCNIATDNWNYDAYFLRGEEILRVPCIDGVVIVYYHKVKKKEEYEDIKAK